jgi:hypothetical protein
MSSSKVFTNATGAPVADNTNIMTAGPRGPALLQDIWLMEKLAHFDREVIPERRMHAKRHRSPRRFYSARAAPTHSPGNRSTILPRQRPVDESPSPLSVLAPSITSRTGPKTMRGMTIPFSKCIRAVPSSASQNKVLPIRLWA